MVKNWLFSNFKSIFKEKIIWKKIKEIYKIIKFIKEKNFEVEKWILGGKLKYNIFKQFLENKILLKQKIIILK